MIISFAYTTAKLLAGKKTVTRRRWAERQFKIWQNAYRSGKLVHDAYDKSPRAGGKKIAQIRLTCQPYKELLQDMPDSDVQAEGGLWRDKADFIAQFPGSPAVPVTVIRFELFLPEKTP